MLQSILLEHGSMKAVPPYLWGPGPAQPRTAAWRMQEGIGSGAAPFQFPKAGGCGQPLCQAITLVCMFETPLKLWDVSSEFPTEPLNTPKKSLAVVPAARAGVSRWGWEQSPALAPLGPGDGKQQVGVSALWLCLQRKHSLEKRVPRGLEWGEMAGTERPCCKELWWLLQSSELKSLRLRAA